MPKLKCPVEDCSKEFEYEFADKFEDARIKLIAHVAAKHAKKNHEEAVLEKTIQWHGITSSSGNSHNPVTSPDS